MTIYIFIYIMERERETDRQTDRQAGRARQGKARQVGRQVGVKKMTKMDLAGHPAVSHPDPAKWHVLWWHSLAGSNGAPSQVCGWKSIIPARSEQKLKLTSIQISKYVNRTTEKHPEIPAPNISISTIHPHSPSLPVVHPRPAGQGHPSFHPRSPREPRSRLEAERWGKIWINWDWIM